MGCVSVVLAAVCEVALPFIADRAQPAVGGAAPATVLAYILQAPCRAVGSAVAEMSNIGQVRHDVMSHVSEPG